MSLDDVMDVTEDASADGSFKQVFERTKQFSILKYVSLCVTAFSHME